MHADMVTKVCNAVQCSVVQLACHCAAHWLRHSGHHGSIITFFSGNNVHLQLAQDSLGAAAHDMQASCIACYAKQDPSLRMPVYLLHMWAVHATYNSSSAG